jgi:alkaline phosphatase
VRFAAKAEGGHGRPDPAAGDISTRQQALVPLASATHAGEDVALFATGPGASAVRGVIEQNVIYHIMRKALGWEP